MNPDLEKRVPREILEELIEEGTEAFRGILEKLFNVAMQLERSEFLGAEAYERIASRRGYRNGLPMGRGGPHRLDHLAAFLRWTPQFLLPPVREILRGGEPEGKVPLRMFFQASVHLLRRRPSVRRVRSLAVV